MILDPELFEKVWKFDHMYVSDNWFPNYVLQIDQFVYY